MTERSLQVTYRKGKPFAAYLHLVAFPCRFAPRKHDGRLRSTR